MARGRHPTRIYIDPPSEQVAAKYLRTWWGGDILREPNRFPGLNSPELFGNNNPLEIDFGCGTGTLACRRAKQNPNINVIGIDASQKPLFCAIEEANSKEINNVKFVRNNFSVLLPLLKPQTITTAYYLFPNPPHDYFQERANNGRRRFLETIYDALIDGGRFIFATDSPAFFSCMETIITITLHYKVSDFCLDTSGIFTWYRSIWESRGRNMKGLVVEKVK